MARRTWPLRRLLCSHQNSQTPQSMEILRAILNKGQGLTDSASSLPERVAVLLRCLRVPAVSVGPNPRAWGDRLRSLQLESRHSWRHVRCHAMAWDIRRLALHRARVAFPGRGMALRPLQGSCLL